MRKLEGIVVYLLAIAVMSEVLDLWQSGQNTIAVTARAIIFSVCGAIGWGIGQFISGQVLPKKTIIYNAAIVFFFASSILRLLNNSDVAFYIVFALYVFASWLIAQKMPQMLEKREADN